MPHRSFVGLSSDRDSRSLGVIGADVPIPDDSSAEIGWYDAFGPDTSGKDVGTFLHALDSDTVTWEWHWRTTDVSDIYYNGVKVASLPNPENLQKYIISYGAPDGGFGDSNVDWTDLGFSWGSSREGADYFDGTGPPYFYYGSGVTDPIEAHPPWYNRSPGVTEEQEGIDDPYIQHGLVPPFSNTHVYNGEHSSIFGTVNFGIGIDYSHMVSIEGKPDAETIDDSWNTLQMSFDLANMIAALNNSDYAGYIGNFTESAGFGYAGRLILANPSLIP